MDTRNAGVITVEKFEAKKQVLMTASDLSPGLMTHAARDESYRRDSGQPAVIDQFDSSRRLVMVKSVRTRVDLA